MFRFSRNRRVLSVGFDEFMRVATSLVKMTKEARPHASVGVLTCEDMDSYQYSQATFMADEATDALEGRKSYALEKFDAEVWSRSMSAQLTLKDASDPKPFMICLSLDRKDEPRSMMFYGQAVEQELTDRIMAAFRHSSTLYSIGDGYGKPSASNPAFGRRLTGIPLA